MMRQVRTGLMVAALAALGGCGPRGVTEDGQPVRLVPMARSPIPDVPLPATFEMTDKSFNTDAPGGLRMVDHIYEGREDMIAVRQFYVDQMPTFGWTLTHSMLTRGSTLVLDFQKASEDCKITITDGDWWNKTEIRAEIRARGSAAGAPGGSKKK